jgi:hypothetical protein
VQWGRSAVTRGQIAGWTIWIGGWLAFAGYYAHQAHDPAVIAKAKAQRAQEDRAVGQTLARAGCSSDMEYRDDGKTPAETVAKSIIAKCGAVMQFPKGSCSATCMREMPRIALQVETKEVLEERYQRAQARADDAKAALERAQPH